MSERTHRAPRTPGTPGTARTPGIPSKIKEAPEPTSVTTLMIARPALLFGQANAFHGRSTRCGIKRHMNRVWTTNMA
jgi:hypothetical protein